MEPIEYIFIDLNWGAINHLGDLILGGRSIVIGIREYINSGGKLILVVELCPRVLVEDQVSTDLWE
jgi:hypothetical protein